VSVEILGTETLSALIPSLINTTENAISRFGPEDRNCYQDKEFQFNYLKWSEGYRYSKIIRKISFFLNGPTPASFYFAEH